MNSLPVDFDFAQQTRRNRFNILLKVETFIDKTPSRSLDLYLIEKLIDIV